MGGDLARRLGGNTAAMMRGHGCVVAGRTIREAVYAAVYMEINARLQTHAMAIATGEIRYLSPGEIDAVAVGTSPSVIDRAWENWCLRAGRPFKPSA